MLENFTMEEALAALGGVVAIGIFIARFTKTSKDDAFFVRAKAALGRLKKNG